MSAWRSISSPTKELLFDIFGFLGGPLYICGANGALFRSDDQGGSWVDISIPMKGGYLTQINGSSPSDVFVVGYTARSAVFYHCSDGRTFKKLSVGRLPHLRSIGYWGDELYAIGSRAILKSVDHGQSFEEVFGGYLSADRLICVAPDHVLSFGYDTILATNDGGAKWKKKNHHIAAHLTDMKGSLAHGLYAVGAWDLIKSSDGGETWEDVIETDHSRMMHAVEVWGPDDIYVAQARGRILHIKNKKEKTEKESFGEDLRQIRAIGDSIYAVGHGGVIVHKKIGPRPAGFLSPPAPSATAPSTKKTKTSKAVTKNSASGEAKLREEIEKGKGKSYLFLHADGIVSLEALGELGELEQLSLWGPVPDLSTLPVLPRLKVVSLYGKCKDLSPLSRQPMLEKLEIERTSPTLAGLSSLRIKTLNLRSATKVTDLASIAACGTIEVLSLPKEVGDLEALQGSGVRELSLESAPDLSSLTLPLTMLSVKQLADAAKLPKSKTLRKLYLSGDTIKNLKALASYQHLIDLDISAPAKLDLSALSSLSSLESLGIGESVSDLSPLKKLTGLKVLTANKNIQDLTPLSGMTQLEELHLDDNLLLDSLRGLEGLSRLKALFAQKTRVKDLSPLAGLASLETLYLSETKVESIEPLRALTKLTALNLSQTPLRSLRGIEGAKGLRDLYISKTKVTDLEPLRGMSELSMLDISQLESIQNGRVLSTLSSLSYLSAHKTQMNPSWLEGLEKLSHANGVELPASTNKGPMGQALGPGMIFDGNVGSIALGAIVLNDVALSPDGSKVAVAMQQAPSVVLVYETKSSRLLFSFGGGAHTAEGVVFSDDGGALYYSVRHDQYYNNDLSLYQVRLIEGAEPIEIAKLQRRYGGQLLKTPRGLGIVGDRIDLFDLATKQITKTLMGNVLHARVRACMSLDAPLLYAWGLEPSEIARYDLEKGEVTQTWSAPYQDGQFLSVSRGERFITATTTNAYGVYVIDVARSERVFTRDFYAGQHITPAVVSADGSLIISLRDVLKGYRTGTEIEPVTGPRTGASYGHHFTAVDVAKSGATIACTAINYRGDAQYLIWFSLCENR